MVARRSEKKRRPSPRPRPGAEVETVAVRPAAFARFLLAKGEESRAKDGRTTPRETVALHAAILASLHEGCVQAAFVLAATCLVLGRASEPEGEPEGAALTAALCDLPIVQAALRRYLDDCRSRGVEP